MYFQFSTPVRGRVDNYRNSVKYDAVKILEPRNETLNERTAYNFRFQFTFYSFES
jgi:hypothetical protein